METVMRKRISLTFVLLVFAASARPVEGKVHNQEDPGPATIQSATRLETTHLMDVAGSALQDMDKAMSKARQDAAAGIKFMAKDIQPILQLMRELKVSGLPPGRATTTNWHSLSGGRSWLRKSASVTDAAVVERKRTGGGHPVDKLTRSPFRSGNCTTAYAKTARFARH
jgi:hypothetical protein